MSNLRSVTNAKLPTCTSKKLHQIASYENIYTAETVKTHLNDDTQTTINHSAKKLMNHKI